MHTLPLFADIPDTGTELAPSWLSAIGFDIARNFAGQGWIVLIDPESIPSDNQCKFYGIDPKHLLVIRSSKNRSVDQIIEGFSRFNTASAIFSWSNLSSPCKSATPVFDVKATLQMNKLSVLCAASDLSDSIH